MNKKLATGIQVVLGFLLGTVLNVIVFLLGVLLSSRLLSADTSGAILFYGLSFIGAVQLIWQAPAILLLKWKGHKSLALGVILAVSITALLNATCWGLLKAGTIRIGG